jgi:hypothetical protein
MAIPDKKLKKINKIYDGTYASVLEIMKEFELSKTVVLWAVDHKGYREKHKAWMKDWRVNHPEAMREINGRAVKKYLSKPENRKKANAWARARYHRDVEKSRKYFRDRYHKNHAKMLKYSRDYYKRKKDEKREKSS